jgi:hypothetical protein
MSASPTGPDPDLRGNDAAEQWRTLQREGSEAAIETIDAEGGSATDAEFASELGCSLQELLLRAEKCELFFLENDGARRWPRWQIGLVGLPRILRTLRTKHHSSFTIASFFLTPSSTIHLDEYADVGAVQEGDRPLDALRRATAAVRAVDTDAERLFEMGT